MQQNMFTVRPKTRGLNNVKQQHKLGLTVKRLWDQTTLSSSNSLQSFSQSQTLAAGYSKFKSHDFENGCTALIIITNKNLSTCLLQE